MMTKEEFDRLSPRDRGYAVYKLSRDPSEPHVPAEGNPFPAGTEEYEDWNQGACEAVLEQSGALATHLDR